MTRIDIPLVLVRPDLSKDDPSDAAVVRASASGRSETVCRDCIEYNDVIVSARSNYSMLPAQADDRTQMGLKGRGRGLTVAPAAVLFLAQRL